MMFSCKENSIIFEKYFLILIIFLGVCTGCTTTHGRNFDIEKSEELVIGQSTRNDVERLLGKPYGKIKSKEYDVTYVYTYNQVNMVSTIIHFPADIFEGGPRYSKSNTLYVDFDTDSVVRNIETKTH